MPVSSSWPRNNAGFKYSDTTLHPSHSFPVLNGVSALRSGLVAAAESVSAEIGRGREDPGLLAGREDTGVLG